MHCLVQGSLCCACANGLFKVLCIRKVDCISVIKKGTRPAEELNVLPNNCTEEFAKEMVSSF